jgi:hypothetical protein
LLGSGYSEKYNWGVPGIGNRAIIERLAECHHKNKISKDDTVIVQWTSHLRNDYFNPVGGPKKIYSWKTSGSIFNVFNKEFYNDKWLETFFDEGAYLMHSLNYIKVAEEMLDNIGWTWYMTGMGELRKLVSDIVEYPQYGEKVLLKGNSQNKNELLAWEKFPSLESYNSLWTDYEDKWIAPIVTVTSKNPEQHYRFKWQHGAISADLHPSVPQHIDWLKLCLLPKLNIDQDSVINVTDTVSNNIEKVYKKYINKDPDGFYEEISKIELHNTIKWPRAGEGYN